MPVATREGLSQWWTNDVVGDDTVGGRLEFRFGGSDRVAVMDVIESTSPSRVVWRGAEGGPVEWKDTIFTFDLLADGDETVVLFTNAGWRVPVKVMHDCTTPWASYRPSLKHGLKGDKAARTPTTSTVSSWG